MRIGRVEFGLVRGSTDWSFHRALCRCYILGLGRVYFTWLDNECKCAKCERYECVCWWDV